VTAQHLARLAVVVALAWLPGAARAQGGAPADSSLHRFLGTLADSTDRYFGLITTPVDTAGLDSALSVGLEKPWKGPQGRVALSALPYYGFNRVDGNVWGGRVGLSNRRGRWSVRGELSYAAASDTWLGGGDASYSIRRGERLFQLRVTGGRRTDPMDRNAGSQGLVTARALILGSDPQSYLRRDGFTVTTGVLGPLGRAALAYRNWREAPLPVRTRWNMAGNDLVYDGNVAATPGRTSELVFGADAHVFSWPFQLQVGYAISDEALGSDFDYRRGRAAFGGELSAFQRISFAPQLIYGSLGGDPIPQASFYLGGPNNLATLSGDQLGGTGLGLARLDIIGADDLLALAHVPHPAMFPIQGGVFASIGGVWGADPYGGPGSERNGWPDRNAWRSEGGVSLLYRPGIPDEDAYLRVNLAWPLGPRVAHPHWSLTYARTLDFLRPF
jgi:hypothetical protein